MALTTVKEIREAISAKNAELRRLNEESAGKRFTEEQKRNWDSLIDETTDLEGLLKRAEQIEKGLAVDSQNDEFRSQQDRHLFEERRKSNQQNDPNAPLNEYEKTRAFNAWALGRRCMSREDRELAIRAGYDFNQSECDFRFNRGSDASGIPFRAPKTMEEVRHQKQARESRADNKVNLAATGLKAADGSLGGYTVPDAMMGPLESALLQWGGMRQVATILTTDTGADLPIPTTNDTSNKGEMIAENTAVNQLEATFAQVILGSFKYSSKMINLSVELLQDSALNLPALLGEMLGTRIGRITNDDFTTGAGSAGPRGIVTAAANSSVTSASATALTYAEILSLKHSVDPAYRANAGWMMPDGVLVMMKKIADSTGRPIWLPSLAQGAPATFDGDPYVINQSMSSAAAAKALLYGDFSKYMIREVRGITLLRLDERYAEKHQVAFVAFARYDGDLIDAGTNPVKYLTLHA